MREVMKSISESTTLTLSLVLALLAGVASFAWSAASTNQTVQKSAKDIQTVSEQLVLTTSQLRAEIQLEVGKRILRHEAEAWISEFKLMNPNLSVPNVPRFN